MSDATAWLLKLEELSSKYETVLQSLLTVNTDLRHLIASIDSPIDAVLLELQREKPFQNILLGLRGSGEPTETYTEDTGFSPFTYRVSIWRNRRVPVDVDRLKRLALRLAEAHWKTHLH